MHTLIKIPGTDTWTNSGYSVNSGFVGQEPQPDPEPQPEPTPAPEPEPPDEK